KTVEHSSQKALRGFLRCALAQFDDAGAVAALARGAWRPAGAVRRACEVVADPLAERAGAVAVDDHDVRLAGERRAIQIGVDGGERLVTVLAAHVDGALRRRGDEGEVVAGRARLL